MRLPALAGAALALDAAFNDHVPVELSEGGDDGEHGLAEGRAGVEVLGVADEIDAQRRRSALDAQRSALDADRHRVLSTDLDQTPILSLQVSDPEALLERLMASEVVISVGGDKWDLARISPGIYSSEADMDRLAEILNA